MSRQDQGAATGSGWLIIPPAARGMFELLAAEFDRLAGEQDELRRAARLAGKGYSTDAHRIRMTAYRRCAKLARAALPGLGKQQ